jgi:type VI secretion system secreted protein Hcp
MVMRTRLAIIAALTVAVLAAVGLTARDSNAVTARSLPAPTVRVFMQVTGQSQGAIHGETARSRVGTPTIAPGQIAVYSVSHSVVSPRDVASGLPTGARQHKPLVVKIDWSKASPQLYQALVNNENLPHVVLSFYEVDGLTLREYAKITLTNANVVSIDEALPATGSLADAMPEDGAKTHIRHMESVAFTYQKIEWVSMRASKVNTSAEDDWESPEL